MEWLFFYFFIFSFSVSTAVSWFFSHTAHRLGFLDYPGKRKIHKTPTPLLGGAAIFTAVYITSTLCLLSGRLFTATAMPPADTIIPVTGLNNLISDTEIVKISVFLAGGIIIFITGLVDDRKNLHPSIRIAAETMVAVMVATTVMGLEFNGFADVMEFLAAVFFIVGVINGFNLIDGINGLCAGNAIIASLILLLISIRGNNGFAVWFLIIFIGALTGFFILNFPKARIFSGSSGSMYIGYSLSVLVMFQALGPGAWKNSTIPLIMPALILAIPSADTLLVIYRRIKTNRSIFMADTNHIHHRMRRLRMTDTEVTFIILLTSFVTGFNAILLYKSTPAESVAILIQAFTVFLILEYLMRIKERRVNRRHSVNGKLRVWIKNRDGTEDLLSGFIVDMSNTGIMFCLLNLNGKFMEDNFFKGRKMKLEFLPTESQYITEQPFRIADGRGILQEKVAGNAVKIGLEFSYPANSKALNKHREGSLTSVQKAWGRQGERCSI